MFAGKPIIGLVGGIGSGKSFVANLLADEGCMVIDSDAAVSEAYHRTCVLCSEVRRNIIVETLAAAHGRKGEYLSPEDMAWMMQRGDSVVYPELVKRSGKQPG